jgi:hypothetical protein
MKRDKPLFNWITPFEQFSISWQIGFARWNAGTRA